MLVIKYKRYCTDRHMWAEVTPDGNVKVGMTDYAVKRLEDAIALVELSKEVRKELKRSDRIGTVYSRCYAVRADGPMYGGGLESKAFDLSSPVSGRINTQHAR